MIHRYSTQEIDLEQVRKDLENSLENPELADNFLLKDFSDLKFQIEYTQDDTYTALSEEYSLRVTMDENLLEVETAEKEGEEFETSKYTFMEERVEMPDRSIGGRETNPMDAALRKYARELYPEKEKPGKQDAWNMDLTPAERD